MVSVSELQAGEFFEDFSGNQTAAIAPLFFEESFAVNRIITCEGNPATRLYVFSCGEVSLYSRAGMHQQVILSTIDQPGVLFGCSALVAPYLYRHTVRCLKKTDVLSASGKELNVLFDRDPALGMHFMKKAAERIYQLLLTTRSRLFAGLS